MELALLFGIRTCAVLVLAMPLLVIDTTLFPFIVGKALLTRVVIEIMVVLWMALVLKNRSYGLPRSWLLVAFALYLMVALLAGITGVSLQRSLWSTYERMQGIVDLAHWFMFVVVLVSVFRSYSDWRFTLNVNLGVSLIMSLLGLAQHLDAWPFEFYHFLEGKPRLDITLGNPTYVGAYMLVNVFVGLALLSQSFRLAATPTTSRAVRRRRRRRRVRGGSTDYSLLWWRLFWIIAIALDFWMLTLSGTRGAFIGISAALVVLAVGYILWGYSRGLKVTAVGLLGVLFAIALLFGVARNTSTFEKVAASHVMLRRVSDIGLDDGSVKGRLAALSAGIEGFAARPLLGWGPENYIVPFGRYFEAETGVLQTYDQAHNKLVEELVTKGTLGFLSYIAIWAFMFWVVIKHIKRLGGQERLFALFIGAALAGFFVQNLFLFDTPATVLQFMLLLAFVVYLETTLKEPVTEQPPSRQTARNDGSSGVGEPGEGWMSKLRIQIGAGREGQAVFGWIHGLGRAARLQPDRPIQYTVITGVVLVLLGLVVYSLNFRAYSAATEILEVRNPFITWDQRLDHFDQSIDSFPPLANYPRLIMFKMVSENFQRLTPAEAQRALASAEAEARRAIATEPQQWRIYSHLALLYQNAAIVDPKYLEVARSYLDRATELAPETESTLTAVARQKALEAD